MLINLLSSNIHFQILHSLKFESLKVWTLLIHKYIAVRKLNCVFTLYIPLWISWENLINWWRHFSSGDHFVNSHNVFSWRWMAFLQRNLMLVTPGTSGLLRLHKLYMFCFRRDFAEILWNSSHAKNVKTVRYDFVRGCFVHYLFLSVPYFPFLYY